jgi:hypothetical protein
MRMRPLGGIALALMLLISCGMVVGLFVFPVKALYEALSPEVQAEKARAEARRKDMVEQHFSKRATRADEEQAVRQFREFVSPEQLNSVTGTNRGVPLGR